MWMSVLCTFGFEKVALWWRIRQPQFHPRSLQTDDWMQQWRVLVKCKFTSNMCLSLDIYLILHLVGRNHTLSNNNSSELTTFCSKWDTSILILKSVECMSSCYPLCCLVSSIWRTLENMQWYKPRLIFPRENLRSREDELDEAVVQHHSPLNCWRENY